MKKPVPRMRRLTIPVLLCCLPLQPLVASANIPVIKDNSRMGLDFRPFADITVKGRVTDEKGQGLPGVNVVVKGTTNGAQTDADGNYTLTAPDNGTLVVSYVGYVAQEVAINGRTTVAISLAPDTKALNEVVVVGYLTQDRQNLTSAVSSVDVQESAKTPVPTIAQAIQGRVPGVQVEGSGSPGAVPNIVIRGIGSLNAGSSPLYVVDGLWTDNIRNLSPNDIESATVLKDASSTAVYGSRGANGVVLITTKKGQAGATKIGFNGYFGVENIYKKYNLANQSQWADLSSQAFTNAGLPIMPGANKGPGGAYTDAIDTDWQKEFFRTGKIQDYNLSFSGGSANEKSSSNYLISAGYFSQDGIVQGPSFERYNLRLNSGFQRGRLRVGQTALLTHIETTLLNNVPFVDVLTVLPGIPVYDPTHRSGFGFGDPINLRTYSVNPIGAQQVLNRTQNNNLLQGSVNAEFSFFDFLSYKLNVGLDAQFFADRDARGDGAIRLGDPDADQAYLFENRGTISTLLAENTLNFNKRFGEHNVNAVAGYSEQKYNYSNTSGRNTYLTLPSAPLYVLNAATGNNPNAGGTVSEWAKRSFFGQVTYDYKGRYLLTGSFRRDGSSRFDPTRQYGNFGAGSVGWRISEEEFFKSALPSVNNLKLRASYGVNGNDNLDATAGNYAYQATVNQNVNYILGTGQAVTNGAIQIGLESRGIRWEPRYTTDFGFDLSMLDNRLSLTADYYISTTKNALVAPPLPTYLGSYNSAPYTNLGEIVNKGFELGLGYHENRNAFTYGADLSLTTLKNEVTKLSELQPTIPGALNATRTQVGQPISRLFLVPMVGIFQSQDEIDNYKSANGTVIQPLSKPGDVKYEDVNGDGVINSDTDRKFIGNPFPKLQGGLNLTAGYKGVDLSIFFQGVTGNDIFNSTRASLDQLDGVTNFRSDIEPWTPENHSNTTPRVVQGGGAGTLTNGFRQTTRWVEDGSYLRLRNIQLGYTLPESLTKKIQGLGTVRVYVTGRNVFTITKYTGFDPETPGVGVFGRGVDDGSYPNVRTFTGGLQLNF